MSLILVQHARDAIFKGQWLAKVFPLVRLQGMVPSRASCWYNDLSWHANSVSFNLEYYKVFLPGRAGNELE